MALLNFFKKRKEIDRFLNKRKTKTGDIHEKQKPVYASLDEKEKKGEALKENKSLTRIESYSVLKSPHITEKSSIATEKGAYVFKVRADANKIMIKKAVKDLYNVYAKKINIINIHSRKKFTRGRKGNKPGFKKAIVYLEKGTKIEI